MYVAVIGTSRPGDSVCLDIAVLCEAGEVCLATAVRGQAGCTTQPITHVDKRMLESGWRHVPCDAPPDTFRIDAGEQSATTPLALSCHSHDDIARERARMARLHRTAPLWQQRAAKLSPPITATRARAQMDNGRLEPNKKVASSPATKGQQ